MNAFSILDKDSNPISINKLDEEAAIFWGKEVDTKSYANPGDFRTHSNWYDTIGWTIANVGNYTSGWHNVVNSLIAESIGQHFIDFKDKTIVNVIEATKSENTISIPEKTKIGIFVTLEYYKPYIQLINHWMEKGYQPKQIVENKN